MASTWPEPVHPQYRADIDGLRAVAVLSVVCFHAFPRALPGGFIGVDVFFVISGYLITSIILQNLERDSFRLAGFYGRRIRRIFPALIVVLAAVMACGWYLLVEDELQELGWHIVASSLFLQNFALWSESGYFDRAAQLKPLLHLWSLAIEEQFYLLWPLLLAAAWRRGWSLPRLIGAVFFLSFGIGVYLTWTDASAAYYFPVSRFWELAAGGGLACVALRRPDLLSRGGELRSLAGLAMVIAGFLLIGRDHRFPGVWALLPVLGAVLVISSGSSAWLNRWFLSSRPMVWIGLISYPLYLWHWPILSLLRIVGHDRSYKARLAAIALAVVAAWLTYAWVEKPLRRQARRSVPLLLAASLLVMAFGAVVHVGVLPPRHEVDARLIRALRDWDFPGGFKPLEGAPVKAYEARGEDSGVTLFVGDSHVEQYGPRVVSLLASGGAGFNTIWFVTHAGCSPVPGVFQDHARNPVCVRMREFFLELARNPRVRKIVIGGCWNCYFSPRQGKSHSTDDYYADAGEGPVRLGEPRGADAAIGQLGALLSNLGKEKKVYLLLDTPTAAEFAPRHYISGNRFLRLSTQALPRFVRPAEWQERIRFRLRDVALASGASVIDPASTLCNPSGCIASTRSGEPAYKDSDHLRPFFVRQEAGYIDAALKTTDDP